MGEERFTSLLSSGETLGEGGLSPTPSYLPPPHVFAFCGFVWVFLVGWFVVFAVGGVVILFVAGGVVILLWCFIWFFGRLAWCMHFK